MTTMMRTLFVTALASALGTTTVVAQAAPGVSIGLIAGAALPLGDFGKAYGSGYVLGSQVGFRPEGSPVGFRAIGLYSRFDTKSNAPASKGHSDIVSFSANLTYALGTDDRESVRTYLLGGVGLYTVGVTRGNVTDRTANFGVNGGAGVDVPLSGLSAFAEVRIHSAFTEGGATNYVPIVVGVRF